MENLFGINEKQKLVPLGNDGRFTAVDLFCGAGGVSQGMSDAGVVDIIAAVNHSDEAIERWTKTVMQSSQNGMPIALWLIHEQNKGKTMMSSEK